jgi:hypothetical protein
MQMTITTAPVPNKAIFLAPLGAAAALLIVGTLAGWTQVIGLSERAAFLILSAIGFSMCAFSPLGAGARYGWANPRHLAGYVLGGLALVLSLGVLFNLPFAAGISAHAAFLALAGIIALKIVVAALYPRR